MTDSVDNLTTKTEKLAIDEKYETNWCDMPTEIKRACVEMMNFHTRYQLRCTASQEKEIVDSLNYKFDHLCVCRNGFSLREVFSREAYCVWKHEDNSNSNPFEFVRCGTPKMVSVLTLALKKVDFDIIAIGKSDILDEVVWEDINTLFKPKKVIIKYFSENDKQDFGSTIKYLKKCWNHVDSIDIVAPKYDILFEELFTIPSIITTKRLLIECSASSKTLHHFIPLIEKWIESNAEIGTRLVSRIFIHRQHYPIDELFDAFENRKISRQDFTMRIKTDNDGKHILMSTRQWGKYYYIYCVVIPSDIEESQYYEYINLN